MINLASITSRARSKLIAKAYQNWIIPGSKVLDVGCGNGVVSKRLAKDLNIIVEGCDILNYLAVEMPFYKMNDMADLPRKKTKYSATMFNDVLHHVPKDQQIILIKKALNISQTALIFEVRPTILGFIFDYLLNKIHNSDMPLPFSFRTTKEWEKSFKEAKINYKTKELKSPLWNPFSNIVFKLQK